MKNNQKIQFKFNKKSMTSILKKYGFDKSN